jgi:putative SOS response-associated peptidase YedK
MTMTDSTRAALEAMTDAQLAEIIQFAQMDQTNDIAARNAVRREAQEAEDILHDRQSRAARDEFRKVRCIVPASHFAEHIPPK